MGPAAGKQRAEKEGVLSSRFLVRDLSLKSSGRPTGISAEGDFLFLTFPLISSSFSNSENADGTLVCEKHCAK